MDGASAAFSPDPKGIPDGRPTNIPWPFPTGAMLQKSCGRHGLSFSHSHGSAAPARFPPAPALAFSGKCKPFLVSMLASFRMIHFLGPAQPHTPLPPCSASGSSKFPRPPT